MHKMIPSGNSRRGNTLAFGSFGIKAMETVWITSRQIEAARVALTRHLGRESKVWIRIFPDKPITKKSPGTRMGKGKGNNYQCHAKERKLFIRNALPQHARHADLAAGFVAGH